MSANKLTASERVREWRKKNPGKSNIYNQRWYRKNKRRVAIVKNRWRKKNRLRLLQQSRVWKQRNPEKVKAMMFKSRYGHPFSVFEAIFARQNGLCAICKTGPAKFTDHDHRTGKIRGLLCPLCNFILGFAKDSILTLRSAISYLKKSQ